MFAGPETPATHENGIFTLTQEHRRKALGNEGNSKTANTLAEFPDKKETRIERTKITYSMIRAQISPIFCR